MANASGGLLIYGVEETELPDGRVVPKGPTPLTDHSLRDKLEDILDSTVSPRLRLEAATIDTEKRFFLLVRVHERAGPLHMLEGYDEHRYYARRGRRVVPMTEREVTQAYEQLQADFYEPSASSFGQTVAWWIEALDSGAWRYEPDGARWRYDWKIVDQERQLSGLV